MTSMIPFWGFFLTPGFVGWSVMGTLAAVFVLGYTGAPLWLCSLIGLAALAGWGAPVWLVILFVAVSAVFVVHPVRQYLVSSVVLKLFNALGLLPHISETERVALEAGVVWMEAELFSGKPDFKRMLNQPLARLSPEETRFFEQ